jgi:CheY-like chemotaxis protein
MAAPRPRVLVLEDGGALRDVFRDALGHADFEVDTAATATEAARPPRHPAVRGDPAVRLRVIAVFLNP